MPPRRWLALAVLCVSLLMVTLDNLVLNVALPTLVRDLHATTTELQWIVDAYVIVFAGLLLVAGSIADRVGRKRVFITGLAAFAAGSTWAAFSGSVALLIAARASMGIGGAMMMPSTLAIITSMFRDGAERQRAIGIWSATTGAGIALGPIVGGLLLARFWWGSVFLINVPVAVLGGLLALRLVPESRNPAALAPDFSGALLSVAGLGLLLWSLIEAPSRGWTSPRVLAAGAGGLAVLALFATWEHHSSHPLLDLGFFRDRRFSAAVSSVGLVMFGLFGSLFVLTQYLQFSLGYSALQAGLRVLPAAGAIAIVAPLSTILVRVAGTKLTTAAGLLSIGGGLWQVSTASTTTTFTGILAGLILLGVGAGLAIPAATASVVGSVPGDHVGIGSAANGAFLQVGGALGVAIIGSLLNTRYQGTMMSTLAPYHIPQAVMAPVRGSIGGALTVAGQVGGTLGTELGHLARTAFVSGMDLGLETGAAVAVACMIIALAALPSRERGSR
jgi:EmrB/QacA subfamily drug resistance transporter